MRDDEIGALWIRITATGEEILSGEVNGVRVQCFPVKSDNPKAPVWRVLKEPPKGKTPPPALADSEIPFAWLLSILTAASVLVS